jgi:peptidoglycan/LPS O-acetylase OafA/YrhL
MVRVPGWLLYVGAASYTIYLTQLAILSVAGKAVSLAGIQLGALPVASFLGLVLLTAAAGCLLHRMVEKPLLLRLQGRDPTAHQ